jgi:arginine decarboxylase
MKTQAPNVLWLTQGTAEGDTKLNAFDNALVAAGIGQFNLVKVTSVAPELATLSPEPVFIEAGSVVPAVLSAAQSSQPGEVITASIAIGFGEGSHGMIMEHAGPGHPEEMEPIVRRMVDESFARRGLTLDRVVVQSSTHRVERIGAAVTAVVLWWR